MVQFIRGGGMTRQERIDKVDQLMKAAALWDAAQRKRINRHIRLHTKMLWPIPNYVFSMEAQPNPYTQEIWKLFEMNVTDTPIDRRIEGAGC